jgi:hypothetical protein
MRPTPPHCGGTRISHRNMAAAGRSNLPAMPIHLRAEAGAYAPAVLCPGDPRRAEYIAQKFFTDPKLVNEERGLLGFTGTYDG